MHPFPQYFEKQCYWMRGKVRTIKKRCHEGMFCSEIEVFRQEKGHVTHYQIYSRDRQMTGKILSMTKERLS